MTDVNHPPQHPENPAVAEGEELSADNREQRRSFADLADSGHAAAQLRTDVEPVLTVEDLKMWFPVKSSGLVRRTIGHVQAVDGISFQVPRGGSLGLVGESGCGKSTTGRLITRLYTPTAGSMRFGEKQVDLATMSNRELKPIRRDVQMIFQDPYTSLNPRHTVGAIIGAPLEVHKVVPKNKVLPRVQELLDLVQDPVSLETPIGDGDSLVSDLIPDLSADQPETLTAERARASELMIALGKLQPRQRRVVVERFGLDGVAPRTLEEVGTNLGITRERVRQLEARALRELRAFAPGLELYLRS